LSRDELALLLSWLLEGSRGGKTRARILILIMEKPMNIHQLAKKLGLNYRTIAHHIKVLEKHGIVRRLSQGYGAPYALTKEAETLKDMIARTARTLIEG
jgi:DNA-binding transcriptional ArsR family regulator